MTEFEKRVKLAEAMGWWLFKGKYWQPPNVTRKFAESVWGGPVPIDWDATPLPDPFTSADDDYAVLVLEVYRDHPDFDLNFPAHEYLVGNYARAALKLIGESDG